MFSWKISMLWLKNIQCFIHLKQWKCFPTFQPNQLFEQATTNIGRKTGCWEILSNETFFFFFISKLRCKSRDSFVLKDISMVVKKEFGICCWKGPNKCKSLRDFSLAFDILFCLFLLICECLKALEMRAWIAQNEKNMRSDFLSKLTSGRLFY